MSSNPQFEVPVDLREFAQKSVEQARKAFEGFVNVAQKTADAVDTAGATMRANAKSVGSKTLGYAEQHRWLVDVQLASDALIVSAVVLLSGGVTSYFSLLYVLPIIAAGTLLPRRGAITVASRGRV